MVKVFRGKRNVIGRRKLVPLQQHENKVVVSEVPSTPLSPNASARSKTTDSSVSSSSMSGLGTSYESQQSVLSADCLTSSTTTTTRAIAVLENPGQTTFPINESSKNNYAEKDTSTAANDASSETHQGSAGTMIIYEPQRPPPLPESFHAWLQAADAVLKSKEMKELISNSCTVIGSASGLVLHVAFLPVTIPLQAISCTSNVVIGTAGALVGTAGSVVENTGSLLHSMIVDTSSSDSRSSGQSTSSRPPLGGLVHNVTTFIPFLFHTAGEITMGLGETALQLVLPAFGGAKGRHEQQEYDEWESSHGRSTTPYYEQSGEQQQSGEGGGGVGISWKASATGESSSEHQSFLDRLRLDIPVSIHSPRHDQDNMDTIPYNNSFNEPYNHTTLSNVDPLEGTIRMRPSRADISKYLLRVDDLAITITNDDPTRNNRGRPVLYIDLGRDFADEVLTSQALAQLVSRGLRLIATNEYAQFVSNLTDQAPPHISSFRVDWKPEGSTTNKLVRKFERSLSTVSSSSSISSGSTSVASFSMDTWNKKLETNIGVWSGCYRGTKHYGSQSPLFLARGIVKMSPRKLLNLLWDSGRTSEYNNYCLGRSDLVTIKDDILSGGRYGAKIIKSETKVPFTGMSVILSVLMHAKALHEESDDHESFIIMSRSLDSGMAGCHVGTIAKVEQGSNKNEILLGANFLRSVPDNPGWTDLTCLSQVNSSLVPHFLAKRIGMMGVEDFFNNVRSLA